MAGQSTRLTMAVVLWVLAALLAWTAVAVRYYRSDDIKWSLILAGLACAVMGGSAWTRRSRARDSPTTGRDRDPAA